MFLSNKLVRNKHIWQVPYIILFMFTLNIKNNRPAGYTDEICVQQKNLKSVVNAVFLYSKLYFRSATCTVSEVIIEERASFLKFQEWM